jgi:hypothetical protein
LIKANEGWNLKMNTVMDVTTRHVLTDDAIERRLSKTKSSIWQSEPRMDLVQDVFLFHFDTSKDGLTYTNAQIRLLIPSLTNEELDLILEMKELYDLQCAEKFM